MGEILEVIFEKSAQNQTVMMIPRVFSKRFPRVDREYLFERGQKDPHRVFLPTL
jgi:uncharacterized protein YhfF